MFIMKVFVCIASLFTVLMCSLALSPTIEAPVAQDRVPAFTPPLNTPKMRLFDEGWRFSKTDNDTALRVEADDSHWRSVTLPHDWSIEDLPQGRGVIGPFSTASPGGTSTGFTVGGVGVYRKEFTLPAEDAGKQVSIYFDGVYMESDVWINGHHLGFHPNGYTAFHYELTPYLHANGKPNTVVVRSKNIGENSRWYSGSGIYRHVWLRVTDPVHIPVWGIFVTTPKVSQSLAQVEAAVTVNNQRDADCQVVLRMNVIDSVGTVYATQSKTVRVQALGATTVTGQLEVQHPRLWSIETPSLYLLETIVEEDGKTVDMERTTFGIRSIAFSPSSGFQLNGKSVVMRGACLHHDNGILGAAAYDRAEQRKLELLKKNGFNAVRSSHNIPSQQFLDACDRLGLLVIDEAFDMWEVPKKPDDYHRYFAAYAVADIQRMVLRDRNHPSVVVWSYGNEIFERADTAGITIGKRLIEAIKELDNTRPVTQAMCTFWEHKHPANRPWEDTAPAFALMDVHAYNYNWRVYENDHLQFPERIIIGTESFANEAFQNDSIANALPYVIGDFVWTGMDYLGEAGIGQATLDSVQMTYPWYNGFSGDLDLIGNKKPQSYYRDVVWGRSVLEMAVEVPAPEGREWVISKWGWRNERQSWNWGGHENQLLDVYVYSPAERVELLLNGERISDQPRREANSRHVFHFRVPYKPGELTAITYSGGKEVKRKSLVTTGGCAGIKLVTDRKRISPNPNDLAFIEVQLIDEHGRLVMDDDREVRIEVAGAGELLAVGNANPTEMKSFQHEKCMTYQGRSMLVIRPTSVEGECQVRVYAPGMDDAFVSIEIGR